VLIALYFVAMRVIFAHEQHRRARESQEVAQELQYAELTLRSAVLQYSAAAVVVIAAALWLPRLGAELARQTGLGEAFVGSFFIAITTSLPEIVVSLAAVRIGALDLGVGNVLGSNLFNLLILGLDDVFYREGPLLASADVSHSVSDSRGRDHELAVSYWTHLSGDDEAICGHVGYGCHGGRVCSVGCANLSAGRLSRQAVQHSAHEMSAESRATCSHSENGFLGRAEWHFGATRSYLRSIHKCSTQALASFHHNRESRSAQECRTRRQQRNSPMKRQDLIVVIVAWAVIVAAGCARRTQPVVASPPPPAVVDAPPAPPPPPDAAPDPPAPVASLTEEEIFARKSLDELNAERPLTDVFFDFDSASLRESDLNGLQTNAQWLSKWTSTRITIEGHCDSRGTAEYNLALAERRAAAARSYLISLGISADRITTVSKGKEQPFCRDDHESCWQQNRRGHFIITAK
jgi:peptidoglycan-associated lipoprotein